ncbi:glycoside hydrolase family 18 protein, partial [Conidiobolus coronatus NRRL 28638]
CPLNICCSKDGFCDTTPEHCGKGCQSNCDSMAVESISFAAKKHDYTHIHFAFGALDFDGNIAFLDKRDTTSFEKFAGISGNFKKVLSIGGWAFNDPPTEKIFSRVMADPNKRKTLIRSVADVMRGFYLDGIDFDWEYPVAEMSKYLDYIVYMTYDLHGQWEQDIKNKPAPFLMSHVNWTETKDALRMMTRAGVPTHKVIMGVGAYGRSFKQERIDCHTPDCKFVRELATPGECTSTGGDLSWNEINRALQSLNFRDYYYDQKSDSDIMLYGVDQWVAYTTPETIKVDK